MSSRSGAPLTHQLEPYDWSNEETAAYEAAIEAVNGAVSAYSALIAAEEGKAEPDQGLIERAHAARSQPPRDREGLRSGDREQIAAARRHYAQVARDVRGGMALHFQLRAAASQGGVAGRERRADAGR
ncbi:hypothetical protein [Streptomyces sp. NPDC089799]|uniref:hypothetical protein n=1 Tax=Streptomyces sp. NPDC089799 TaxID=3155066 RepID=UPI003426DD98